MARRRISAFFFHIKDKEKFKEKMQNVTETESIVLGDIEDKDLKELVNQKSIVVNEIESQRVETPGRVNPDMIVNAVKVHPPIAEFLIDTGKLIDMDETRDNIYIVSLKGPLTDGWRKELDSLEVKPIEKLATYSFTAKLTPDQARSVTKKTFVQNIRVYDKNDTNPIMSDILSFSKNLFISDISLPRKYDIILHLGEDSETVMKFMNSNRINIIEHSGKKIRCETSSPLLVEKMKELPEVALVDLSPSYRFHCDVSRLLVGVDAEIPNSGIIRNIEEQGEGQMICVADGGIFGDHPDLKNNLAQIKIKGNDKNDHIDKNGHGTHVAGIIVGNGVGSNGKFSGMAPKAKLFFQSLKTDDNVIEMKLSDTTNLLEEAYNSGARICNYSFGSSGTQYSEAYEVDEFISDHPDMLVIRSAGNEANALPNANRKTGFVGWYSLDAQATFKNGLSVGASESLRTDGPNRYKTWKEWNMELFPDDPIASQKVSGNRNNMAAFSGRGPAFNTRIKPDVVAPGVDILSTRSLYPETQYSMRDIHENPNYAYLSGTSFSAPIVAGSAALVREYYIKKRNHYPSAALLKATLINGTKWLTGQDATADHNKSANIHQGFGLINIQQSIPNKADPKLKLEFVDSWKNSDLKLLESGSRRVFEFSTKEELVLRLCMTYSDLPGPGLQNNLSLFVENLDRPMFWIGNEEIQKFLEGEKVRTDLHNNVETIRIDSPFGGTYRIHVVCWDIIKPPQDFALVLTGSNISSLKYVI